MKREILVEEFIEAYNDFEAFLPSVLDFFQDSLAKQYLILSVVEKTERKMKAINALYMFGISVDDALKEYTHI